jgi:hypothetical protein
MEISAAVLDIPIQSMGLSSWQTITAPQAVSMEQETRLSQSEFFPFSFAVEAE